MRTPRHACCPDIRARTHGAKPWDLERKHGAPLARSTKRSPIPTPDLEQRRDAPLSVAAVMGFGAGFPCAKILGAARTSSIGARGVRLRAGVHLPVLLPDPCIRRRHPLAERNPRLPAEVLLKQRVVAVAAVNPLGCAEIVLPLELHPRDR